MSKSDNLQSLVLEQFDANEQAFPALSERAAAYIKSVGFPEKKDEEYRYTPITRAIQRDFSDKLALREAVTDEFDFESIAIDGLDAIVIDVAAGEPVALPLDLPAGLHLLTLADAQEKHPEVIANYFNKVNVGPDDSFQAWNTMFTEEGIVVIADAKTTIEKPIWIRYGLKDG